MADPVPAPDLEALLEWLKESRGFDFTGYKRPSLARRVDRRMHEVGISSYSEYRDYLEVHQDEFANLFNTILINVTSFFRDPESWEHLGERVLPDLLARNRPIRAWSAGCASGQEAYSLAMLLTDSFPTARGATILATDLSRDVLARAARGTFSQLEVNRGLPAAALVRHFERDGAGWRVREPVRSRVEFRQLNLARPWPALPPMDVVLLRNVLIYFGAEAKRAVLSQMARVLAPGGLLFLGGAETTYGLDESWERLQVGRTSLYRPVRPEGSSSGER